MTLQLIIVYVIGAFVLLWIARRIYCRLIGRKGGSCESCGDRSCPHHKANKK